MSTIGGCETSEVVKPNAGENTGGMLVVRNVASDNASEVVKPRVGENREKNLWRSLAACLRAADPDRKTNRNIKETVCGVMSTRQGLPKRATADSCHTTPNPSPLIQRNKNSDCGTGIIFLPRDCMAIPELSGFPRRGIIFHAQRRRTKKTSQEFLISALNAVDSTARGNCEILRDEIVSLKDKRGIIPRGYTIARDMNRTWTLQSKFKFTADPQNEQPPIPTTLQRTPCQ